jgi:hypothetical protein
MSLGGELVESGPEGTQGIVGGLRRAGPVAPKSGRPRGGGRHVRLPDPGRPGLLPRGHPLPQLLAASRGLTSTKRTRSARETKTAQESQRQDRPAGAERRPRRPARARRAKMSRSDRESGPRLVPDCRTIGEPPRLFCSVLLTPSNSVAYDADSRGI